MNNISVIVGAGRSGTTILKEFIGCHNEYAATEFELNHLWRYGNSELKHDFLSAEQHFSKDIANYIGNELERDLKQSGKPKLIEKTVANVARVEFVAKTLPEAKIIHLIRDGRAVTASAIQRWQAKPSGSYLLKKSKTVPIKDIPRVAFRYFSSAIRSLLRKRNYRQSWGPRWGSIDEDVKTLPLARVCARQWKICVESALEQGRILAANQYLEIRYEDLVSNPKATAQTIADFLEISADDSNFKDFYENKLSDASLEKWKTRLTTEQIAEIESEAGTLLKELGYS